MIGENKKKEKKVSLSWETEQCVFLTYWEDMCVMDKGAFSHMRHLAFFCSPAFLAITVWMEYSLEEFVSPVNAMAMQLSVIFTAFAL